MGQGTHTSYNDGELIEEQLSYQSLGDTTLVWGLNKGPAPSRWEGQEAMQPGRLICVNMGTCARHPDSARGIL